MVRKENRVIEERRPAIRVPLKAEADYTSGASAARKAQVREISASGLRVATLEPLAIGQFVDITVMLRGYSGRRQVRLLGQVVRLVAIAGPPFEYGVKVVSDRAMKADLRAAVLALTVKPICQAPVFDCVSKAKHHAA